MRTKSTEQLMRQIRVLTIRNISLEKENKELRTQNILFKSITNTLEKDLKECIKKYNKLTDDIKKCYPTFTIN